MTGLRGVNVLLRFVEPSVRRTVALLMVIKGMARLGVFSAKTFPRLGEDIWWGWILIGGGVLLYLTQDVARQKVGIAAMVLATIVLGAFGFDLGYRTELGATLLTLVLLLILNNLKAEC